MTNEELLQKINDRLNECTTHDYAPANLAIALRKVVELHKPRDESYKQDGSDLRCKECTDGFEPYPCPTIQAIEEQLQ